MKKTFAIRFVTINNDFFTVDDVTEYGVLADCKCFYYESDGLRSYLPMENILYIGPNADWE